jgi:hypothetical protein
MVVSPARKISARFTSTYAGFEGESQLLEELYKRGLAQPHLTPDLRAGDGMLMAWHHEPIAPWQTEAWLAEMRRSLRPSAYLRQIENRFVTTESNFIETRLVGRVRSGRLRGARDRQRLTHRHAGYRCAETSKPDTSACCGPSCGRHAHRFGSSITPASARLRQSRRPPRR